MREMLCFYKSTDIYGPCVWWDGFMLTKYNGAVSFQYLMGNVFNVVFARHCLALLNLSLGFVVFFFCVKTN